MGLIIMKNGCFIKYKTNGIPIGEWGKDSTCCISYISIILWSSLTQK